MRDNPYASPKAALEPTAAPSEVSFGSMTGHQRLVWLGGYLAVLVVLVASAQAMLSLCELIEGRLGAWGLSKSAQWMFGIVILVVPLLLGKATAILYKRRYGRIAGRAR